MLVSYCNHIHLSIQYYAAIRTIGRVTQGVKLVKLDSGSSISSITRVISEETATEEVKETEDKQLTIEGIKDKNDKK